MALRDTTRLVAALVAVAALTPAPAGAQNPTVSATYGGIERQADFTFRANGATHTRPVGALNWTVPDTYFGTESLGRTFKTYCAEPLVGVAAGNTYRFDLLSPTTPAAFGLPDTDAGRREAAFRAALVRRLFDRHYTNSIDPADRDAGAAFQVALWELVQETDLPAELDPARATFDLYAGTFRAEYPDRARAPAFVARGQKLLQSLTEPDPEFADSLFTNFELVRLDGLPNATGPAAQDQYALRQTGEGVGRGGVGGDVSLTAGGLSGGGGAGGAGNTAANGPGVLPGFGGGGGSVGGGAATNPTSLDSLGGGNNSSSSEPSGSRSSTLLNRDPPLPPPPVTSPTVPPNESPQFPSSPVPAPPGLILGGIAGVVLLLRTARRVAKK